MMKGSYICMRCGKSLASSQSLWNHKQRCKDTLPKEIPTFDGSVGTDKLNSKETMNKRDQFLQSEHPRKIPRTNLFRAKAGCTQ